MDTLQIILTMVGWIVPATLTYILGNLVNKMKKQKEVQEQTDEQVEKERKLIQEAVKHILRHEIEDAYHYYTEQGYCTATEKAELDEVYKIYSGLGGNGRGKRMFDAIIILPEQPVKVEENI